MKFQKNLRFVKKWRRTCVRRRFLFVFSDALERVAVEFVERLLRVEDRKEEAVAVLERGGVAIIAGGTGNPFFTTDSGAALRALEIGADAMLKGTRVDGVYTADPEKDPSAVKYDELTFDEAISKKLKVMDQTAYALCSDGNMPIIVFDMNATGNLTKLLAGEKVGTLVHP